MKIDTCPSPLEDTSPVQWIKMAIFKDEEMSPPPVPSTAKTPGKPKGGIVPFRDEVSVHLYLSITVTDRSASV